MLQALATNGMSPNWSATRTPAARQRALRALLREIGKPERPRTLNRIHRAVAEVSATVSGMDRWLDQPQRIQQALIGLAASMARHLQDEQRKPLSQADSTLMGTVFSRMTKWSGEHRPGFVAGLSRANSPDSETWIQDARDWWAVLQQEASPEGEEPESTGAVIRDLEERLEDGGFDRKTLLALVKAAVKKGVSQSDPRLLSLLAPHRDAIRGAKGLKTLKTQLRQASLEAPAVVPVENLDRGVPPDWPLLDKTRGNVAVIVGGDDRPHAADRIQAAFEFATVEWETGQPRRAAALAERIRGGRSVDVVILLREFVSHKFPDMLGPACKEAGIPMVVVDRGYGVTQVRLAFERFLGGPSTK